MMTAETLFYALLHFGIVFLRSFASFGLAMHAASRVLVFVSAAPPANVCAFDV